MEHPLARDCIRATLKKMRQMKFLFCDELSVNGLAAVGQEE